MFKKPPFVKASSNISSRDRRKLINQICDTYKLPKLSKEGQERLVPSIVKKATFKSFNGDSGTVYFNDQDIPIYFHTRDSIVYPTIYTLWSNHYILKVVKTHSHVIEILGSGANLMLPGTIPKFFNIGKNELVGVVSSEDSNRIMAIGFTKLNLQEFDNVLGRSGTAVEIIHHYNDELLKLNKEIDIEIPEVIDTNILIEEEKEEEIKQPEQEVTESVTQLHVMKETESEEQPDEPQEENHEEENEEEKLSKLTVEEIDNFFIRSLYQTIKLDTVELPITASTFMSSYIYKNLPIMDHQYTNIKKTSWKKTSKFLKAMNKLNHLDIKGKDEDLTIIKLKRSPIIDQFVPHKINKPKTESKKIINKNIRALYKPTAKSRHFFNKLDQEYDALYTSGELRAFFDLYIKKSELAVPTKPKFIKFDDNLKNIINPKKEELARDEAFKGFLKNFSPYYEIDGHVGKGTLPKIQIITEMKIGRKIVTRVSNYEKFNLKQGALAEEMRYKCQGSTTTTEDTIQVQGPHGKLLIEMFKDKGIPISYIEFEDKVKKKKRS
ncbi:unnamed protein product [Candida verbasci]|uniref:SUI1 domain-containing protein n=1 Tax=Candida verbasci TaxID=1227364 RepID=A0A9W4TZT6_9ASCO|nr:unnamed protein product [Candida verbasci]